MILRDITDLTVITSKPRASGDDPANTPPYPAAMT